MIGDIGVTGRAPAFVIRQGRTIRSKLVAGFLQALDNQPNRWIRIRLGVLSPLTGFYQHADDATLHVL